MSEATPTTHVTTKPNTRALTPIEVLRGNLDSEFSTSVENYYRGDKRGALQFKTAVVDYVRKVPKLLECNRQSLLSAFVQLAQFNFMPSSVMGEAYVIPYGAEAKFQIGYQGIVSLLYRTNKVKSVTSTIIYKNDTFEYEEGLTPRLYHKPTPFGADKGEAIGVYTVAVLSGGVSTFKVMSKEEVMEIKELSKAKSSKESPWNSDKDPQFGMWRKTCLIQHSKFLPKTADFQVALEKDMDGEGMEKNGGLDAGGIAVGRALHGPQPVNEESQEVEDNEPIIEQQ